MAFYRGLDAIVQSALEKRRAVGDAVKVAVGNSAEGTGPCPRRRTRAPKEPFPELFRDTPDPDTVANSYVLPEANPDVNRQANPEANSEANTGANPESKPEANPGNCPDSDTLADSDVVPEEVPAPEAAKAMVGDRLKESEQVIQRALADIVTAARDRSEALKENRLRNASYDRKEDLFGRLRCAETSLNAVIGNNVQRASKRNELDTAVRELDVKNKCAVVYDENKCLEFLERHETVLLQMAVQYFSRANSTKCSGVDITVSGGPDKFSNRIVVRGGAVGSGGTGSRAAEGQARLASTSVARGPGIAVYEVKGLPKTVLEKNFVRNPPVPASRDYRHIKPTDRVNLDVTKAEASHVFSTLRRLDPRRPLYYAGRTFYQRKRTCEGKFRWTEVVGWDESKESKVAVRAIGPSAADRFVLPESFNRLADQLLERYKGALIKTSVGAGPSRRKYYRTQEMKIDPRVDAPIECADVERTFDSCLDVLLALGKNSAYTKSTVKLYRGKFRRYLVFCFAFYTLNRKRHADATSPLPFNFLNLFSYMYCHGPDLHASSFLSTLTFLNNHVFDPIAGAAPAASAKRLLDVDFSVLRGGKGASVRDFGSAVKTSIHTRTLVSFLGYAEMAMGVTVSLLVGNEVRPSDTLADRISQSLERWCDSILFVFFTFVLFHRFSAVKRVSLDSALRLVMGQTHAHTNKVRASKLVKISGGRVPALSSTPAHGDGEGKRLRRLEDVESAVILSHPHLLGLPFGVQAALGIPISKINPLMAPGSGGITPVGGKRYLLGNTTGVFDRLAPLMPGDGKAAGNVGMFENLVKDMIDRYYGAGTFSALVDETKKIMNASDPYDPDTAMMTLYGARGVGALEDDGGNNNGRGCPAPTANFAFVRDVEDYLMASPMRMVFVKALDCNSREVFLSVGDLALLAIWCKVRVLGAVWDDPAVGKRNYEWLGSTLCRNLLLADLTNFGMWGDLKVVNRLDTHTNTFHRDNERLPTPSDQRKLVKNTPLEMRRTLALLHSCVNVRTRTHLGRVSATSWAVDALRTVTRGDKNVFVRLAASLDLHHLGHLNSANFVPYFSQNYASNEQELGLWGYVRRTSERLAKEELARGRLGNLDKVGVAQSNVAAAAVAISATRDVGEAQAVLDGGAKERRAAASLCVSRPNADAAREKVRAAGVRRLIRGARTGQRTGPEPGLGLGLGSDSSVYLLKDLWGFFADQDLRRRIMAGKPATALCRHSGFLNATVPDRLFEYDFDSPASCFRLRIKFLGSDCSPAADPGVKGSEPALGSAPEQATEKSGENTELPEGRGEKRRASRGAEDRAVLTLNDDPNAVLVFDKYAMARTNEGRGRLEEQDRQSRVASGIKRVCERQRSGASKRRLQKHCGRTGEESGDENLLDELNRLAFAL
uniref:Wsv433-like protein n=1 Tax=Sicyonia whispovirus TaxID=2984283 RepID=A0A9C7EZ41_9VIRU|nr:MAG: wsv433-like protein [Sicyonia whispovirus]